MGKTCLWGKDSKNRGELLTLLSVFATLKKSGKGKLGSRTNFISNRAKI